jgi:Spy/CpxP family protein refolding chaperone
MHTRRLELKQELEKSEVDTNKINAIITDIKTLTGEQLDLGVNNILAMKQVLMPRQFKKLQDMKEEKHKKGKTKER